MIVRRKDHMAMTSTNIPSASEEEKQTGNGRSYSNGLALTAWVLVQMEAEQVFLGINGARHWVVYLSTFQAQPSRGFPPQPLLALRRTNPTD
jgi:hypothetical protein